jgi:hypothetical protein
MRPTYTSRAWCCTSDRSGVSVRRNCWAIYLIAFCVTDATAQPGTAIGEGAWCWFSEPKAIGIQTDSGPRVVTGWVSSAGDVVVALVDPAKGTATSQILHTKLERDDHDNPAFVTLPDGRIGAFYGKHGKESLYARFTLKPNDISEWTPVRELRLNNAELTAKLGHDRYTYANPWRLSGESDRIYLFWRGAGYKPNISWSDDLGETWTPSRIVISPQPFDGNQRPYVKYFSSGEDRIHLLFTDGHPRNEPFNSVYYACYRAGAFWRAGGTRICGIDELPFEPRNASVVYDAHATGARAWVWDICEDAEGRPIAVYARCPSETDHRYHYVRYDGEKWIDHEVSAAGKWFPQTPPGTVEREQHYSAGITIEPGRPDKVFLARDVNGRFEIESWLTSDGGATWQHKPITSSSARDNVRPYVPRAWPAQLSPVLLWMENRKYEHYTKFDSAIRVMEMKP